MDSFSPTKNNKVTRSPRRNRHPPTRASSRDVSMGSHLERKDSREKKSSLLSMENAIRRNRSLSSNNSSRTYSPPSDDALNDSEMASQPIADQKQYAPNLDESRSDSYCSSASSEKLRSDTSTATPHYHEYDAEAASAPSRSPSFVSVAAHGMSSEPPVEYGTHNGHGGNSYDFTSLDEDNLAVAIAIDLGDDEDNDTEYDDDAESFIPAAVEYDPESKPPLFRNRRMRFYCMCAAVFLLTLGLGSAFAATIMISKNKTAAPTSAPTTTREGLGILSQLISVVGETNLMVETHEDAIPSAHVRAANWIINEDPLQLQPDDEHLIQRYLAVLFYMSTTERQPWRSCNPLSDAEMTMQDEDNETDSSLCHFTKLVQAFPEVRYENTTEVRWLSVKHECDWAGIFCDEFNQLRVIELPGMDIRGTLPSDIAHMPYLQSLALNWNDFYGTLPSELASMKHLLNIEVHYNFLTGPVPPEWYAAQSLQRVNVAGNFLSGSVPTEIGELSSMKGFFSFENSLVGTIPTEIGMMKFLSFTRFGRNFMTGTMPSEIGNLDKLQELWFHRNQLTGELPSEMGNMRDLGDLRLHMNSLQGTIPEEHYNMPQLRRWDLYDCNFTGTISTAIGLMLQLKTFHIRGNHFSGTLPSELGMVLGLDSVWLHGNDLTGSMPAEVCSNRGRFGIQVLDADCLASNGDTEPRITCLDQCCTACCDTTTGYCNRENTGTADSEE